MNKKTTFFIILFFFVLLIVLGIYFFMNYINTNNSNTNYNAEKTSNDQNISNDNNSYSSETQNNLSNVENNYTTSITNENIEVPIHETEEYIPIEEELGSFSTKIHNQEEARQNNIKLVTSALNGTIVKNGDTFSFTSIVGPATTEKGYQKANVIDKDGNNVPGLGGGMCQVSTTVYNAVLSIPSLTVTERHPHTAVVPYIESGKDAAVAYGSLDLKFVNNTGYDVKLYTETTGLEVIARIVSLK